VNPGQYKVAGRERQGEEVIHGSSKALLARSRAQLERNAERYAQRNNAKTEGGPMPEKETLKRARRDARQGKSPSTQAGEFVREEIHHIREGKHGARSTKQAIAIGLSKARQAGVKLPQPKPGTTSEETREQAARDTEKGKHPRRKVSVRRSRAMRK